MFYPDVQKQGSGSRSYGLDGPPTLNPWYNRIKEGPNLVTSTPYSHYNWVGGPPNTWVGNGDDL